LFGRNYDADQFLNQIISYYRQANSKYDGKIFLSGHSAGAQFANRYLVRHPDKIHAAAFSAPAWFALPNYDHKWPNGMGKRFRVIRWEGSYAEKIIDITPSPNGWLKAAQLPVTVVVGELDLKKIRHVKGIGGDNHVERAKFWVNSMNQYAETNGKIGTVRLNIKEGVGHNFGKLAGVCQESIREHVESHLTSERKRIYGSKP
jgi:pimeloyl-ACP methyl ester carboxylesterase